MKKNKAKQVKYDRPVLLEADSITKKFRKGGSVETVFQKLNIEVRAGDALGILAPSGTGKTTLMNCLLGIEKVDDGTVYFEEENIELFNEKEQSIRYCQKTGVILAEPSLLSELNLIENIELPALLAKRADGRSQAKAILEKLGIEDLQDKNPDELTSLQYQLGVLARAWIQEPLIVFADEPTARLNRTDSVKFMEALLSLRKGTQTALLVFTDDLSVAMKCDKLFRLEEYIG